MSYLINFRLLTLIYTSEKEIYHVNILHIYLTDKNLPCQTLHYVKIDLHLSSDEG